MTERLKKSLQQLPNAHRGFHTEKSKSSMKTRTRSGRLEEGLQFSHRPQIDENSRLIAKKWDKCNTSVYERLYAGSYKAITERGCGNGIAKCCDKVMAKNQSSFTLRLYAKAKAKDAQVVSKKEETQVSKQSHNYINDKHAANRFLKEFNKSMEGLSIEGEKHLDYKTVECLMSRLGFAPASANSTKYKKLLAKMLNALDKRNKGRISTTHLKHFIAGVLNIDLDLKKSSTELQEIYKEYKLLYFIRQSNTDKILSEQQLNKPKAYPVQSRTRLVTKRQTNSLESFLQPTISKDCTKTQCKAKEAEQGTVRKSSMSKDVKSARHRKTSTIRGKDELLDKKHKERERSAGRKEPILRIEVTVGGKVEEAFVYENDKAKALARYLAAKHSRILANSRLKRRYEKPRREND
eukprot:TRINITY_DN2845_c0_g2_i1.p1 TRINITY_DN2845_c0_g2~~TRINITY_DN2845_c0_g2_i1.p1  ORF type:complete len:408 (-),score=103.25 TRINITY_DN2845_c0_g2_i1:98-1321(-)